MPSIPLAIEWYKNYFTSSTLDPMSQYLRIRTIGIGREDSTNAEEGYAERVDTIVDGLVREESPSYEGLDARSVAQILKKVLTSIGSANLHKYTIFDYSDTLVKDLRTAVQKIHDKEDLSVLEKENSYSELVVGFLSKVQKKYPKKYELIEKLFMTSSMFLISPHSRSNAHTLSAAFPALTMISGITTMLFLKKEKDLWSNIGASLLLHFYQKNVENGQVEKFANSYEKDLSRLFKLDRIEGLSVDLITALNDVDSVLNHYLEPNHSATEINRELLKKAAEAVWVLSIFSGDEETKNETNGSQKTTTSSINDKAEEKFKKGFRKQYPDEVGEEFKEHFSRLWMDLRTFKNDILHILAEAQEKHGKIIGGTNHTPQKKLSSVEKEKKQIEDERKHSEISIEEKAKQQENLKSVRVRFGTLKNKVTNLNSLIVTEQKKILEVKKEHNPLILTVYENHKKPDNQLNIPPEKGVEALKLG